MSVFSFLMIELKHVVKSFRSGENALTVLTDVSFTIATGESVAIIGPSGSGKSTLLSLMAGLDRPTSGKILFDSLDIASEDENRLSGIRNRQIGYVFQSFELLPSFTALENVLFPLELQGRGDRKKALEILAKVGLKERAYHFPEQLSGGEQQRVAIARAFVHDPEIIFADEPTGNLDEKTSAVILELLFSFVREKGKTLVLITHDPEITKRCDRTLRLHDGTVFPEKK